MIVVKILIIVIMIIIFISVNLICIFFWICVVIMFLFLCFCLIIIVVVDVWIGIFWLVVKYLVWMVFLIGEGNEEVLFYINFLGSGKEIFLVIFWRWIFFVLVSWVNWLMIFFIRILGVEVFVVISIFFVLFS